MTKCDICEIMQHKEEFYVIYEDKSVLALLHESPAQLGHVMIVPKEHFPIFEQIPDDKVIHLFNVANQISALVFEVLGAYGTNILVSNGVAANQEHPHFIIHVIPRKENDGIDFEWEPKKVSDSELQSAQEMLASVTDEVFKGKKSKKIVSGIAHVQEESLDDKSYLSKQLQRIP